MLLFLLACVASPPNDTSEPDGSDDPGVDLVLERVLDTNAVVATKGLDVASTGELYLWNYNQDQLERWTGSELEVLSSQALITSFGTDLMLDEDDNVYVSKGGSQSGETLMKWSPAGEPAWQEPRRIPDALLLGLHASTGRLWAADGTGSLLEITAEGDVVDEIPVDDVPLDLATDGEQWFVLTSESSSPLSNDQPVTLRAYTLEGEPTADPVEIWGAVYLDVADGLVFVSVSDFGKPFREVHAYDTTLSRVAELALPSEYEGFLGGIAAAGTGDELRVWVTAQEGVGSGPICDVLQLAVQRTP